MTGGELNVSNGTQQLLRKDTKEISHTLLLGDFPELF